MKKIIVSLGLAAAGILVWVATRGIPTQQGRPTQEPVGILSAQKEPREAGYTNEAPVTGQRFDRLTREERNLALDAYQELDALALFRVWVRCGQSEQDFRKQNAVGAILGAALRRDASNPAVLGEIRRFIEDRSNSLGERAELLGVLGQAKTREALDTLIQVATGQASAELKPFAIKAIRAAGGLWGDGTFHEELSPALERVWRESNDEELLLSVSAAIAKIGAPGGIELLLSSVRATNSPESSRSRAVQLALAEVINPRAVPPLAAMLGSQPPTGAPGIMAGSALVAIGDAAASKALIDWIRDADASAAGSVRAYVLRTRHPAMLQAWESALDSTVVFRSEANRDAIRSGLDEFHRNRPTNP